MSMLTAKNPVSSIKWSFKSLCPQKWIKLEESKIRAPKALERLYLVVALALLFATVYGVTVHWCSESGFLIKS